MSESIVFESVDPGSPQAIAARNDYFAELNHRFEVGFDPSEGGADHDAALLQPPTGVFIVLKNDEAVIGCGGVRHIDDHTGEIKRMWIDSSQRGKGLGRILLKKLEAEATRLGYDRVLLDTNATLKEAIRLYESAGYETVDDYNENPYAEHWFAKQL